MLLESKLGEEGGAALGAACALLEGAGGARDAEAWARGLAERAAKDEALNVAGMLAAAQEGRGARLGAALEAGGAAAGALRARDARYEDVLRGAAGAVGARAGAAGAERGATALLHQLHQLLTALEVEPCDEELELGSAAGRARALQHARALALALAAGERALSGWANRLKGIMERVSRLRRLRDRLAAAIARHLNNLLIHLGNEAFARDPLQPHQSQQSHQPHQPHAHHAALAPYAPFMRWLKECDEKTYDALMKVYVSCWARVYERDIHNACEGARAKITALAAASGATGGTGATGGAGTGADEEPLDQVLQLVQTLCSAEAEFCASFFCLEGATEATEATGASGASGTHGACSAAARRLQEELFAQLQSELVALVEHMDRSDRYGAMRALAAVGRRVLCEGEGAVSGASGAVGAALAGALVAAKRCADRAVAARVAALPDAVRAAARRPKCGLLPSLHDFEEWSAHCEAVFPRGARRADVERWYVQLGEALLQSVHAATHPRTPRAVLQLENYHRLHALLAALRVPALDQHRRTARARYNSALRAYVSTSFGRPLERLAVFFEGVAEAVAAGARDHEVCYRQAFSKHELKKVLALYPAHEVRKSLHRLYRTVEKQLSEEGGLLQVVWRALQEDFLAQHQALQARIAACYPGAGLALPLSTDDILAAFSDIAREH